MEPHKYVLRDISNYSKNYLQKIDNSEKSPSIQELYQETDMMFATETSYENESEGFDKSFDMNDTTCRMVEYLNRTTTNGYTTESNQTCAFPEHHRGQSTSTTPDLYSDELDIEQVSNQKLYKPKVDFGIQPFQTKMRTNVPSAPASKMPIAQLDHVNKLLKKQNLPLMKTESDAMTVLSKVINRLSESETEKLVRKVA